MVAGQGGGTPASRHPTFASFEANGGAPPQPPRAEVTGAPPEAPQSPLPQPEMPFLSPPTAYYPPLPCSPLRSCLDRPPEAITRTALPRMGVGGVAEKQRPPSPPPPPPAPSPPRLAVPAGPACSHRQTRIAAGKGNYGQGELRVTLPVRRLLYNLATARPGVAHPLNGRCGGTFHHRAVFSPHPPPHSPGSVARLVGGLAVGLYPLAKIILCPYSWRVEKGAPSPH